MKLFKKIKRIFHKPCKRHAEDTVSIGTQTTIPEEIYIIPPKHKPTPILTSGFMVVLSLFVISMVFIIK